MNSLLFTGYITDSIKNNWLQSAEENNIINGEIRNQFMYSYKFKNGEDWEINFNDLGCGGGDTYGNRIFTTGDSDMTVGPFCFNSCTDCEQEIACGTGDANFDDAINSSAFSGFIFSFSRSTTFA